LRGVALGFVSLRSLNDRGKGWHILPFVERGAQRRDETCQRVENAESNAASDGRYFDSFRTNSSASGAPTSRSMPASSHSTDSGPVYPMAFSIRKASSHGTSP